MAQRKYTCEIHILADEDATEASLADWLHVALVDGGGIPTRALVQAYEKSEGDAEAVGDPTILYIEVCEIPKGCQARV